MLLKECLVKSRSCRYTRRSIDTLIYHTADCDSGVGVESRNKVVVPAKLKGKDFDEILLRIIDYSSCSLHDVFFLHAKKPPLKNCSILDAMATEMGRWDAVPHALLCNFIQEDSVTIWMRGCTRNPIIDSVLRAQFTIPVIHHPLLGIAQYGKKQCPVAYLLASPAALGKFSEGSNGFQIVVRPIGCLKAVLI